MSWAARARCRTWTSRHLAGSVRQPVHEPRIVEPLAKPRDNQHRLCASRRDPRRRARLMRPPQNESSLGQEAVSVGVGARSLDRPGRLATPPSSSRLSSSAERRWQQATGLRNSPCGVRGSTRGCARDVTSTTSATQTGSGLGASEATIPERRVGDALICGCSVAFDDPVPVAREGPADFFGDLAFERRASGPASHRRGGSPEDWARTIANRSASFGPHPRMTYGGSDAGNHRSTAQGDPHRGRERPRRTSWTARRFEPVEPR